MLYSLNRWENRELINKLVHSSDYLIADRYTPSNLAYGLSRGLSLGWLQGLDKGLPTADLVIVLDVPIVSSFERKSKNRDVHERELFRAYYEEGEPVKAIAGRTGQSPGRVYKVLRELCRRVQTR